MATTDTRPGFRLPWSTNGADGEAVGTDPAEDAQATDADAVTESVTDAPAPEAPTEVEAVVDDAAPAEAEATLAPEAATESSTEPAASPEPEPAMTTESTAETSSATGSAKKPNKFLADLTRAMRATAEQARAETQERFAADAKAATERVHAVAADEATELRRAADDDVAAIRDWSKAEIARIREETENRISGRKQDLEHELEVHAGTVEARIERVSARVSTFETEMNDFYDRLFAEEDPTRFAAMAEQLPEPPNLDIEAIIAATAVEPVAAEPVAVVADVPEGVEAPIEVEAAASPEASVEAAEAPAEAPAEAEVEAVADAPQPEASAEVESETAADPRLAMLEMTTETPDTTDFDAAEAEAAAMSAAEGAAEPAEEIPTIADEVLAARLAGLVPDENSGSNPIQTTKVVVTGLVSVASIAGFKRHLGRLQGVTTVGVSSGPDGEFVFSVHHVPTLDLAEGIATLPGFESKITSQSEGVVEVVARDPEAHD
jgi:hypothetical protein